MNQRYSDACSPLAFSISRSSHAASSMLYQFLRISVEETAENAAPLDVNHTLSHCPQASQYKQIIGVFRAEPALQFSSDLLSKQRIRAALSRPRSPVASLNHRGNGKGCKNSG